MPTHSETLATASEMREATRGLAHTLRSLDRPEDLYLVVGEVLGTARAFQSVLDQLSGAFVAHRGLAQDDHGNSEVGAAAVQEAVNRLQQASSLMDQTEVAIERASQTAGTIAWHQASSPTAEGRFVSIVFLQGEEADRVIELITLRGTDQAIEHLAGYDFGDETVEAALENGYVYDQPPVGQLDKTATRDVYTLVYNPFMGHVSFYRQHDALPDPVLLSLEDPPRHAAPSTAADAAATQVAECSRRERLGTPTVHRPSAVSQSAGRGLGR